MPQVQNSLPVLFGVQRHLRLDRLRWHAFTQHQQRKVTMGFLSTVSKQAAPVPPPAAAAPSKKIVIEDVPSTPLPEGTVICGTPGVTKLIQRAIYRTPDGEERMFICGTPQGFSF